MTCKPTLDRQPTRRKNAVLQELLDYMSEFLLQGASNTWEGKGQVSLPGPPSVCAGWSVFAPGAGAPTRWGDAFDCRSTASVRTESNQYTEPALFAPGAGAPTGVARK